MERLLFIVYVMLISFDSNYECMEDNDILLLVLDFKHHDHSKCYCFMFLQKYIVMFMNDGH